MSPHARSGDVELNPIELDPRGTKAQGVVGGLCFADLLDHNDVWRFDLNGGGDGCDVGLASVALDQLDLRGTKPAVRTTLSRELVWPTGAASVLTATTSTCFEATFDLTKHPAGRYNATLSTPRGDSSPWPLELVALTPPS